MFRSLWRAAPRIAMLALIALVLLAGSHLFAPYLGPTLAPLAYCFGLTFAGFAVGDVAMRIMQPKVNAETAANEAIKFGNAGAGLVYLGRCILASVVLLLVVTGARAGEPPAAAVALLPVLKAEQLAHWPGMPLPSALGAQVEQETCVSLKSRGCWNPRAELKTSREQGIGLGQLTRAFRSDGSTRFDALAEIRRSYPKELAGLSWEKPYDATLQLRALVLKDRQGYDVIVDTESDADRLAMAFAAYNGGLGGLNSDRRACEATSGCNPGKWFGHVELTSLKAKQAVAGYGKSFFEINREYVRNVMILRRPRYTGLDL